MLAITPKLSRIKLFKFVAFLDNGALIGVFVLWTSVEIVSCFRSLGQPRFLCHYLSACFTTKWEKTHIQAIKYKDSHIFIFCCIKFFIFIQNPALSSFRNSIWVSPYLLTSPKDVLYIEANPRYPSYVLHSSPPPPRFLNEFLKVVGNEKVGGSEMCQSVPIWLGPRRSRFVVLLILLLSLILRISVSAPVKQYQ
jgi:hypothetical protein